MEGFTAQLNEMAEILTGSSTEEATVDAAIVQTGAGVVAGEQEELLWSEFFREVDWTERWLVGLIAFHLCSMLAIVCTSNYPTVQIVLFLLLAVIGLSAERINEYAALHWEEFSRQQYFDHNGFFTATVLCTPVLLNLVLLTIMWVCNASSMLVKVKRAQIKAEIKAKKKGESDGGAPKDNDAKKNE